MKQRVTAPADVVMPSVVERFSLGSTTLVEQEGSALSWRTHLPGHPETTTAAGTVRVTERGAHSEIAVEGWFDMDYASSNSVFRLMSDAAKSRALVSAERVGAINLARQAHRVTRSGERGL